MVQNLVFTYLIVALLVMVGLGAYWAHRGRWSHTFNDHLVVVGVGLAWPIILPLCLLIFVMELTRHLSSRIRHELDPYE